MADEELRELERAWRASPMDPAAAGRYVSALRRAGRVAPLDALEIRVLPSRRLQLRVPVEVAALRPDGVWRTVRAGADRRGLEAPAHVRLDAYVGEHLTSARRALLAEDLQVNGVEGVSLGVQLAGPVLLALRGPVTHVSMREGAALQDDLDALAAVPGLVELDVGVNRGLERVARVPALERLTMTLGDLVTDDDLRSLSGLQTLRHLTIRGPRYGTRSHPRQGRFMGALSPELRSLDLSGCSVDDHTLELVVRHTKLHAVALRDASAVTDAGVARLASLPLRALDLEAEQIGDPALAALAGLALERLRLRADRVTDAGWGLLPATLDTVSLVQLERSVSLEGLSRLRSVTLEGPRPERWLDGVPATLETLGLCGRHVEWIRTTPSDLRPLARFSSLRALRLDRLGVPTDALRVLHGAPALRTLSLHAGSWTNDHLQALPGFPALEVLELTGCEPFTERALESVAACSSLRRLVVEAHEFDPAAVAAFRDTRPDVELEVR
jgi:hypothetical protein